MGRSIRGTGRLLAGSALSLSLLVPPPFARARADEAAPPPALVGRLGVLAGNVSFHQAGADGWVTAALNEPVTSGDAVFAEAGAHAEIEAGTDLFALDGGSELDVATLDASAISGSEPQGRVFVALGPLPSGTTATLATPRGTVTLAGDGTYEIAAGDSLVPTTVTVVAGSATIATTALSLAVGPGQTATLSGTDAITGAVAASPPPDSFLGGMLATLRRFRDASLPTGVAGMTGCQALATTGQWTSTPTYGEVWYPPVQAGWVPYREGHWTYVAPWGWTWIDDEPWGFAPFHYGRWADIGGRWGWVPGDDAPVYEGVPEPVYAPALVGWTDAAEGLVVGAAIGALAAGAVGWVPLGPGEPYVPPYWHGRPYFDRLNRMNVRDIGHVDPAHPWGGRDFGTFANRHAATLVAASAFRSGDPIGRVAHDFGPQAFGARPIAGRDAVPPPHVGQGRPARGPALVPGAFHPEALAQHRLPFRGDGRTVPSPGAGGGGAPLPALRAHEAVETGRPGAIPAPPRDLGPGAPSSGDRPGGDHPGPSRPGDLAKGAAIGAGAAGAAAGAALLARHAPPRAEPGGERHGIGPGEHPTSGPIHEIVPAEHARQEPGHPPTPGPDAYRREAAPDRRPEPAAHAPSARPEIRPARPLMAPRPEAPHRPEEMPHRAFAPRAATFRPPAAPRAVARPMPRPMPRAMPRPAPRPGRPPPHGGNDRPR